MLYFSYTFTEVATASQKKEEMNRAADEKRCAPRFRIQVPLRCQVRGNPEFSNTVSEDISTGGLSFVNEKFIPPSTLLMVEINLLQNILSPVAKVVWSSRIPYSHRYRVGIEFLELDQKENNYLKDYLNLQTECF